MIYFESIISKRNISALDYCKELLENPVITLTDKITKMKRVLKDVTMLQMHLTTFILINTTGFFSLDLPLFRLSTLQLIVGRNDLSSLLNEIESNSNRIKQIEDYWHICCDSVIFFIERYQDSRIVNEDYVPNILEREKKIVFTERDNFLMKRSKSRIWKELKRAERNS
ncbi:hypothetical protein K7I13_11800 [Brucepastera parasyntrophica]|uniref:hypothetical protein n=1 Tax=Brucepastera parasyntrophica TaxID=2880008 RepID=UPI00210C9381|nr:hypothetical protein [Brucepastera parasyntrophica]ULQ59172.1 hypothetical protein K7I13_11800 [Brucepastera parasyntrophica]